MATITASGIGSGLDVNGLVTQLVEAEGLSTTNRLDKQEAEVQAKLSAMGTLKGAVSSFQSSVSSMRFSSFFNSNTLTSSNTDVFTASGSAKTTGNYSVEVFELAQSHKLASKAFTDTTDVVGTGTLSFQFGEFDGTSFTANPDKAIENVTVSASDSSMEGIRNAVNDAGIGVTASIVDDGSGQRLIFSSDDSGKQNSLKITVSDSDLNDIDEASGLSQLAFDPEAVVGSGNNMTQTLAAKDASLKVDGLAITRPSNSVSGVVEGVTLNLTGVSGGTASSLSSAKDTSGAIEGVKKFVEEYNSLRESIDNLGSFDLETGEAGILLGDSTLRSVSSQIRNIMASAVSGINSSFNSLAGIGMKTERDGSMSLDESKLQAALTEDVDAVAKIFGVEGAPSDALIKVAGYKLATQSGSYQVDISQLATQGALAGGVSSSLMIDADNDTFALKIDGIQSSTIQLTQQTYASNEALAVEMQSRINGDSALKNAGVSVAVKFDTDHFEITSEAFGSTSKVELTATDTNTAATLGLSIGAGTDGVDVAGTIDGEAATGSGRFLTASEGDSEGLKLEVAGGALGARGDVVFSRGVADQLYSLTGRFLSFDGVFSSATSQLNNKVSFISDQRDQLTERLNVIEIRFRKQFANLDVLMGKMQATGDFLTQQLSGLA